MTAVWIILGFVAALILLYLITTFICFRLAFYSPKRVISDEYRIPEGEIYEPYRDKMIAWMKETRSLPHTDYCITSFDGLKLYGSYYEHKKGAPIELMVHGYRSYAEKDLCGGVQRAARLGRNALLIDQRGCGRSEGNVITFGINESRDCADWARFITKNIDSDAKIILTGISMGAATVVMAAGRDLPENVAGVLADCGYTDAKEIIKKVIRDMKLPDGILYPFVKAGARLWGKFDLEEFSPLEALQKATLPICFFHGEADDFVPCEMSIKNYEEYKGVKRILTVKGAGHGLCYMLAPDKYLQTFADFGNLIGVPTEIKPSDSKNHR